MLEDNATEASNASRLKEELVYFSQRCGSDGWCPGTLGNISVFNPEHGRIYIKRSGADLKKLQVKDILTLDVDGNVTEGEGKPSIETSFHTGIYRIKEQARAVFHVHPPFATAYAVKGIKIPMVTEAAKLVLVDVPLLPHAAAGSVELAKNVASSFKNTEAKAVLLREHGLVSIGGTPEEAYHVTSLVEDTAKVALLSSLL